MGHNRAGVRRKARLRRSQRELERLAKKASPETQNEGAAKKGGAGKGGR